MRSHFSRSASGSTVRASVHHYNTVDELDLVIYHSHTHTRAYPSATDIRLAAYPDATYAIVTLQDRDAPDVRAFRIRDGEVTERDVERLRGWHLGADRVHVVPSHGGRDRVADGGRALLERDPGEARHHEHRRVGRDVDHQVAEAAQLV